MDIGFVGIGMMGKPMAVNLLKAGHNVTVVNRSQGKVQELAGMGATPGGSPADAARGAEVVGLCLVGDAVVESVLCGEDGVLAGAEPGTIVLDHSTVHPEFARHMEEACAAQGVTYLDAPVSGTGDVAWGGRLTVMVGGDAAAFERTRPALDAVSANARFMGPVGSGNMAKLLNNMVKDINQLGVLETFVLGAKQGLDCGLLFHVMRHGASVSRQLERILPKILDRSFEQTSYVSTNIKDQDLMEWMIGQAGLELPLRNAARDSWLYAAQQGLFLRAPPPGRPKRGARPSWRYAAEQGLASADPPEAIKALEPIAGVEVAGELLPRDADVPPHDGRYGALDRATAAMYEVGVFEAFALTTKLGMDAQAMYEVMRTASGASARLERIGQVILGGASGDAGPSVDDYVACYEPLLEEARRDGLRMPLHEASASLWRRAAEQGLGSEPSSAAYAFYG